MINTVAMTILLSDLNININSDMIDSVVMTILLSDLNININSDMMSIIYHFSIFSNLFTVTPDEGLGPKRCIFLYVF